MAQLVKAPQRPVLLHPVRIFLAGTTPVPGPTGADWRALVYNAVADLPVTVIDPVRADWGPDWIEDPDECPPFREQTEWELHMQTVEATCTVFFFDPQKDGMVSLLELGLSLGLATVKVVWCPRGYAKRGNVVMACRKYGIPVVESLDELVRRVVHVVNAILNRT